MRLCLDHHYPTALAQRLVADDFDVVTAHERGWSTLSDDDLLARCADDGRALLTYNVGDFMVIAQRWAAEGRRHTGLIFTDDRRWPRTADATGTFVAALTPLLNRPDDALADQTRWL